VVNGGRVASIAPITVNVHHYHHQASDGPDVDQTASILAFLDLIDPDELERQALAGHDMSQSLTARSLELLKQWAAGQ
jgi:hypothetical protein